MPPAWAVSTTVPAASSPLTLWLAASVSEATVMPVAEVKRSVWLLLPVRRPAKVLTWLALLRVELSRALTSSSLAVTMGVPVPAVSVLFWVTAPAAARSDTRPLAVMSSRCTRLPAVVDRVAPPSSALTPTVVTVLPRTVCVTVPTVRAWALFTRTRPLPLSTATVLIRFEPDSTMSPLPARRSASTLIRLVGVVALTPSATWMFKVRAALDAPTTVSGALICTLPAFISRFSGSRTVVAPATVRVPVLSAGATGEPRAAEPKPPMLISPKPGKKTALAPENQSLLRKSGLPGTEGGLGSVPPIWMSTSVRLRRFSWPVATLLPLRAPVTRRRLLALFTKLIVSATSVTLPVKGRAPTGVLAVSVARSWPMAMSSPEAEMP